MILCEFNVFETKITAEKEWIAKKHSIDTPLDQPVDAYINSRF